MIGSPGSKTNNIIVIYTPFPNLKKTGSMDVGQVSFHDRKQVGNCVVSWENNQCLDKWLFKVKSIVLEKKDNDILRRLNKTKEERQPDLRAEKEERDRAERQEQRKRQQEEVFY